MDDTQKKLSRFLQLSGLAVAAALTGCNNETLPAFDPVAMQQPNRQRSAEVPTPSMRPLPTTLETDYLNKSSSGANVQKSINPATAPELDNGVVVRMSLQEIIQRAVANSSDVKAAGYQPAIDETRVIEAEARFDPEFFQNLQYQRVDKETGIFSSGNERLITSQTGIRQLLESGGQAELRYEVGWNDPKTQDNTGATRRNEFWANDVVLEVTQPLLRDFGNVTNQARISINRDNQRISLLDFRKQLEQTASDIEKTYWQLVAAEREVKIDQDLLNQTYHTGDTLFKRRGQDVTRVQLSQANASIETRRAALVRAKSHVYDLSDELKRFMNDPEMPVASGVVLLPANAPIEEAIKFDLQDQINTGMENRYELGQQQIRVNSAETALGVARNNELPKLDLVSSLDFAGLANDLGNTLQDQADTRDLNYSFQLQFDIPIGNRAARAVTQRALLQRQQAIEQYRGLIDQVALDIKQAVREVDTTWQEMVANRQARFAATDTLVALNQRETGGESLSPEFVQLKLDSQERLAASQTAEAEAISNYNIALANLEKTKGTLLRYNNIVMQEDALPIQHPAH